MTVDRHHKTCAEHAMDKATLSDPENNELLIEYNNKYNELTHFTVAKHWNTLYPKAPLTIQV